MTAAWRDDMENAPRDEKLLLAWQWTHNKGTDDWEFCVGFWLSRIGKFTSPYPPGPTHYQIIAPPKEKPNG